MAVSKMKERQSFNDSGRTQCPSVSQLHHVLLFPYPEEVSSAQSEDRGIIPLLHLLPPICRAGRTGIPQFASIER